MKTYAINTMKVQRSIAIALTTLALPIVGVLIFRDMNIPGLAITFWGIACFVIGYYLTKNLATSQFSMILTPDVLTIQDLQLASEYQIPLNQVASYSYVESVNGRLFRLRLCNGQKIAFNHSDLFCKKDDLQVLVADFENQRQSQAQLLTSPDLIAGKLIINIRREKTFIEKPIGNLVGWLMIFGLVYFTWHLLMYGSNPDKPVAPFLIYLNGLVYLAYWWNARRTRNP